MHHNYNSQCGIFTADLIDGMILDSQDVTAALLEVKKMLLKQNGATTQIQGILNKIKKTGGGENV